MILARFRLSTHFILNDKQKSFPITIFPFLTFLPHTLGDADKITVIFPIQTSDHDDDADVVGAALRPDFCQTPVMNKITKSENRNLAFASDALKSEEIIYFILHRPSSTKSNCNKFKLFFSLFFMTSFAALRSFVRRLSDGLVLSSSPSDYRTWNESSRHGSGFIKGIREDNAGRAGNYRSPDHFLAFLGIRYVQLESECARWSAEAGGEKRRSRYGELLQ